MSGIDTAPGQRSGGADYSFRAKWNVASDGQVITIPLVNGSTYDFDIDWGDGVKESYSFSNQSSITHTYATAGEYITKITGLFTRLYFRGGGSQNQIIEIIELGDVGWTSWDGAWRYCRNLKSINRSPGLPNTVSTNFQYTLDNCNRLEYITPIKHLTDRITGFGLFGVRDCRALIEFDTRDVNVTLNGFSAFYTGFNGCTNLKRVLGAEDWNTTGSGRIDFTFRNCSNLEVLDTSNWDTSSWIYFAGGFAGCAKLRLDYRNWDITRGQSGSTIGDSNAISQTLRDDDIWSDALKYWATLTFPRANHNIVSPSGSKYRCDALWAREQLRLKHNVVDGGPQTTCDGLILAVNVTNENIFTVPAGNIGTYNATVSWGDGTTSNITSYNDSNLSHTYATAGEYLVTITGDFPKVEFANSGDKDKLVAIVNWGSYGDANTDSSNSFEGCSNLQFVASDSNLPLCTNAEAMFKDCGVTTNTATYPQTTDTFVYDVSGNVVRSTTGSIPNNWARYDSDVKGVSLGSNVVSIGSAAFRGHDSTEINIPSNVININSDAFAFCGHYNIALNFSEGLQTIGGSAFQNTRYSGNILLPTTLTSVASNSFSKINGDSTVRKYYINSPASIFTGSQAFGYHEPTDTIYVHADYLAEYDNTWKAAQAPQGITIREWKSYPLPTAISSDNDQVAFKSGFDMTAVTNANEMFAGMYIERMPITLTLDTVTNANDIFKNCTSLSEIGSLSLANASTVSESFKGSRIASTYSLAFTSATDCTSAFSDCTNLTTINTSFQPTNMSNGTDMFFNVTLDSASYSDFIIRLDQNNINTNVTFYGGEQQYLASAINAHDNLTGVKLWDITDGGLDATSINYFSKQEELSIVSRWKLDESVGKIAIDDISGNDGEYNNSNTYYWHVSSGEWTTDSPLGGLYAPTFKPAGIGRVMDCGSASTFSFIPKTGVFTIEAFVRLDGTLTNDQIWRILGTGATATNIGFVLMYENRVAASSPACLRFIMFDGTGTFACDSLDTSGFVWDNEWHHVVMTGDGTNIKFYIDGIAANGSDTINNLATADNTFPLSIANVTYTSQLDTFEGGLQNVTIYDTTLTQSDVTNLYSYITTWTPEEYSIDKPNNYYNLTDNSGVDIINALNFTTRTNTSTLAGGAPDPTLNCLTVPNNGYMYRDANPTSSGFSNQYTVNIWTQFDAVSPSSTQGDWLWSWRELSTNKFGQIYYYNDSNTTEFRSNDSNHANTLRDNEAVPQIAGKWYMFTLLWDAVNNISKYYIDGVLIDTSTPVNSTIPNATTRMAIGAASQSVGNVNLQFDGQLFGLGMWNTALNSKDVAWLYNAGKGRTSDSFFSSPTKNNLIAWYDLESDGTDSHTGNYDLVNSNVTFASDSVRAAGVFNGSTSRMEASTFPYPNGAHTSACWVRLDVRNPPSDGYGLIVAWTNVKTSLLYIDRDGRVRFLISGDGTNAISPFAQTGNNHLPNNVWTHLAGVYDPDTLTHKVYVNGVLASEQSAPASLPTAAGYLELGSWNNGGSGTYLDGRMANACIFDKALTSDEIKWLMGPNGNYQNL